MGDPLKPLMFTVSLIDKISSPADKATRSFNNLVTEARSGFSHMASGAIGLAGTGAMLYSGLQPALELETALGNVKVLGVQKDALEALKTASMELSSGYGLAVAEVVAGSARLKASIGNLGDAEFIAMTNAAGVLAAGTKTSMDDSTQYIAQMYERFKISADAMGRTAWVDQLVSKTAYLKKTMGADASEIAGVMEGINNKATLRGVGLDEQLAVIATLGKSTGLTEAEQQYTAFLENITNAEEKLGVSLKNDGAILPIVDVIDTLQGKFGNLEGEAVLHTLDDAFGDGALLIQQLAKDSTSLGKTLASLGNIKSLKPGADMADDMTGAWSQMAGAISNVMTIIGDLMLPAIMPMIEAVRSGADQIREWSLMFPNLSRVIVQTGLTILGLTAAMAAVTIAVGIAKSAWAGFKLVMTAIRSATLLWTGAQWALNAAFLASPIGLVAIGITALLAVIYAAYRGITALWDAIADTTAIRTLTKIINLIPGVNIGLGDETAVDVPALQESKRNEVPAGGATIKTVNSSSNKSTTVNVTTNEQITPAQIDQLLLMAT